MIRVWPALSSQPTSSRNGVTRSRHLTIIGMANGSVIGIAQVLWLEGVSAGCCGRTACRARRSGIEHKHCSFEVPSPGALARLVVAGESGDLVGVAVAEHLVAKAVVGDAGLVEDHRLENDRGPGPAEPVVNAEQHRGHLVITDLGEGHATRVRVLHAPLAPLTPSERLAVHAVVALTAEELIRCLAPLFFGHRQPQIW